MTDKENNPLISATTGNKIIVAVVVAIGTAVATWAVTSLLDVKSKVGGLEAEAQNFHEWLTGIDDRNNRIESRVDRLMRLVLEDVIKKTQDDE